MTPNSNPRRALVVIDVQNEYETGGLRIQYPPVADSLRNIGRAMDAAHAAGVPVIVVQQSSPADAPLFATGSRGWELHEVVASRPRDHYLRKLLPSAFAGTDLGAWLTAHAVDTLAVVGYMTHNYDDTTIKHAFDAGLQSDQLRDDLIEINDAPEFIDHKHAVFNGVEQRFEKAPFARQPLNDGL